MAFIQVPEIARKIQRRFGTDGPAPTHTIAPEIVPVALVEDLTDTTPEDTGFQRACFGYSGQSGAASNNSHVQLFNPAGSGVMLHVEAALVSIGSAGNADLRYHDTELSTAGSNESFRDRRIGGRPVGRTSAQNNGSALGTSLATLALPGTESIQVPVDVLLDEGQGILFLAASQNISVTCLWYWQERSKLPGE